MASLDSVKEKKVNAGDDVELAVRMTIKMLRDGGGLKVVADAINQSNDPAQVIGQFLSQIAGQLAEKLDAQYGIDPRIFIAKGGWLDKVLDYIEKQLGYPEEFSEEIYGAVLETIKAAAMAGRNGQAAGPPGQAAPPQQGAQPQAAPGPVQGLGG